jgi:multidrug efflux pump subunit AcrA (membrane-fusion protein)
MLRHPALFCSTSLLLLLAIEAAAVDRITATGVVAPARRATLSARISGRIVEVSVEAGDVVEAGQPLIAMDDAELAKAGPRPRSRGSS